MDILFTDFLQGLRPYEIPLATAIDELFLQNGCSRSIKESASGFTVSYMLAKKSVACFVCRKTGLKLRLTPPKPFLCDEILKTLPDNMKKDMLRANVCKRLSDPSLCNPRCAMGYVFMLDGECYQKCRSMAFLFSITEENVPFVLNLANSYLS